MKAVVIAGTHSGCGKTSVSLAVMAALRKKGLSVQPFKAGPDFIDAGLHGLAAGRRSRNLDIWMAGQDYVRGCFQRHAGDADIAVIEGVMGMYDGEYSTASLARLLDVPVILVIDAYGMAESAGAVVYGFVEFGVRGLDCRALRAGCTTESGDGRGAGPIIAGIIFNRVASENHYLRLKESVAGPPVLGYLPRDAEFEIPRRHLGLVTAEEDSIPHQNIDRLADAALEHIDIEEIIRRAEIVFRDEDEAPRPFDLYRLGSKERLRGLAGRPIRIAVAYDKAFSFYYGDNIDLLAAAGAELVYFSPISDHAIPGHVDAVYIGGGYPELYAEELSGNSAMLGSVKAWAEDGRPVYAECGGLMYLSSGIHGFDGRMFRMTGVFPFETMMSKRPRLGYREVELIDDCVIGEKGCVFRGHEFHYSEIIKENGRRQGAMSYDKIYHVKDKTGECLGSEGFMYKKTLASYIHLHFGSNPAAARNVIGFISREAVR